MIQFISTSSGQRNVPIPPCGPPGANLTNIYVENCHLKIIEIQQKEDLIKVSFRQRLSWLDHRVAVDASNPNSFKAYRTGSEKPCAIWLPNITRTKYVGLETDKKKIKVPFKAGEAIQIAGVDRNTTRIVMEHECTVTFFCDLSVEKFPFDTHDCRLMEMNEETTSLKLLLSTKCTKNGIDTAYKDGFKITVTWHGGIINGQSSHVKFELKMIRILSPVVFQYYLPSMAIVSISQISFILPPSSVPGRIGLLATLFLTLTNLFINHMVSNCEG